MVGMPMRVGCSVAIVLLLQVVMTVPLVADWVENYNVSDGECGWQGTCTDVGLLPVTLVAWLAVPIVEVAVGLLISRVAITILLGGGFVFLLIVQNWLINGWAAARGGSDAAQAGFYLQTSSYLAAAEFLVAVLALLAWRFLPRRTI